MKAKHKILLSFLVLAAAAGAFFFDKQSAEVGPLQLSPVAAVSSAIQFDQSVATEYGTPIKVAHVVDGDTIQLINGDYVRYIGIDTPEEFDPKKPVQCWAVQAAEHNRQLVEGKEIIFYNDVSEKDRYGRWLGFVYLSDGTFINKKLVAEGDAFAYPYKPDISKATEFEKAEVLAKNANLGLWANCDVKILKSGRKQTN